MNDDKFEGGDGGVDVRQEIETQVPHSPPLPEWIVRQREQALRTVREATVQEIACLFSAQVRATVLRIQMGRVPTFDQEWIAVQTAASFLDSPPTEQGQEARSNREVMIIQIIKAHARLSAPRPDPSTIELCWDPERTQEEADEEIRCILDNWTPDPKFAAEHAQHCAQYPWITYRLGYRTSPVEIIEPIAPPRPLRPEKDRFTLMSVRKARERARDRDQPIDARWEASAQTMYFDVVAEIGTCPPMVDVNGIRVYTLDRIKNKLGYTPGNIRWADRSLQRDNQDRNPSATRRRPS